MLCKSTSATLSIFFAFTASLAAQQKDLTYHTIPPCNIINTYLAGGQFAPNETRTYNVVGDGSFVSQGGSSTGCGIPGFSNGIARVQAVAVNVAAFNPTGAGHLIVVAADGALNTSFLNFVGYITVANTGPVAVAQTPGIGDIKINYAVSGGHIVASVVGYYTRFGETIMVGPGATPTASGTALLNALTSIADNSATKPYLIKLEPGVYDVGSTMVVMKPYVDIEGSGQQTTIVQGAGNNDGALLTGIVYGASNAELRNLQVKSLGAGFGGSIGIVLEKAGTRVRDVTVVSSGATSNWGVRVFNSVVGGLNPILDRVTVEVQGGSTAYGVVNRGEQAKVAVKDSKITVSNTSDAYGFYTTFAFPKDLTRIQIDTSGTSTSTGVYVDPQSLPGTLRLSDSTVTANAGNTANYGVFMTFANAELVRSTLTASGGGTSYGILQNSFGLVTVDHCEVTGATGAVVSINARIGATRLSGGPTTAAACAGVYDENYTFFASTCP
ncbi:MAG TPA: hypothetical protein VGG03_26745 [Thermoanaerobaculia bacterium]|jgi:hypothetical protein